MHSWDELDDNELLAHVQNGSNHAFAIIVRRHSTKFFHLAYRFTRSTEEAEDIVQTSFLKLWENPTSFDARSNVKFTTWFHRVIVNRSIDWQKKHKTVHIPEGMDIADRADLQDEVLSNAEESRALENEISQLPERQQVALNLCYREGVSNKEAADIMNINVKALESLLSRAKATLKIKLGGRYGRKAS